MTDHPMADTPFDSNSPNREPASGPIADVVASVPGRAAASPRLWGPWATIGWTLLCIVVMVVFQTIATVIFMAFRIAMNPRARFDDLATNGNLWALAGLLSNPAGIGLVALLIRVRRYSIRDYLALYWPSGQSVAIALAGLAALLFASDLTTYLLSKPIVPQVMVDVYRTAWLPGLLLVLVVVAPIGEETVFRGFLYTGIAASRAGPLVAILVSSIIFAALHVQYDWYGMVIIAFTGLYLGVVRYKAQSLLLNMLLHGIVSAVATLEVIIKVHWFS
jgi:membrane protease YdiL (CAAX protease family)